MEASRWLFKASGLGVGKSWRSCTRLIDFVHTSQNFYQLYIKEHPKQCPHPVNPQVGNADIVLGTPTLIRLFAVVCSRKQATAALPSMSMIRAWEGVRVRRKNSRCWVSSWSLPESLTQWLPLICLTGMASYGLSYFQRRLENIGFHWTLCYPKPNKDATERKKKRIDIGAGN